MTMPSRAELLKLLTYNPDTGLFHRRSTGKPALSNQHIRGYLIGSIMSVRILAHRAAWAITHDEWPVNIDHINRDKTDNRLINLRPATRSLNSMNREITNGTEGLRGVWQIKDKGRWGARFAGQYLGCFRSSLAAARAFDEAARKAGLPADLMNYPNKARSKSANFFPTVLSESANVLGVTAENIDKSKG